MAVIKNIGALISGGFLDGKYIFRSSTLGASVERVSESPLTVKGNIPDFCNLNANGVLQVIAEELGTFDIQQILPFVKKNGLSEEGTLYYLANPFVFIIADNLTDGAVKVIYFGQLANGATSYNGYTIYELEGVASDYISEV